MKKRKIFKKLFILLPNTQMKKWLLLGLSMAAAWVAFPQEWVLTETKTLEKENMITIQQDSTSKEVANTLNLFDATWFDWESETLKDAWNEKKSRVEFHWSARLWSNVTPLLWSLLSDKPALRLTIDASDSKSGIWASVIRFDDFNKNMDDPASQLTMVDLYCQKQFWKFSVTWVWEYVNIDKMPGADSFTPIILCTYDAWKWLTIDACYCHTFQKWTDVEDFRIWATKTFNETFSLAAQAFYKYDWNHKFSGRVQANVNLKNGLWAQLSFTAKDWKITPTAWVMYKF